MELFETQDHYVILDGDFSLWCSRRDGKLVPKRGSDLASAWNPICLGQIFGVIGKLRTSAESEKLLLIRQRTYIGSLPGGHDVYGINKIIVLPISMKETPELGIELCKKHHFGIKKTGKINVSPENTPKTVPFEKTWNNIKTATAQVKGKKKQVKDRDKFDRRITDELVKMFTDTESFYYSPTGDLTNSIQRQCYQQKRQLISEKPLWSRVDERFFWNQHMLQELIETEGALKDHWIVPVIQGFVTIESVHLDFNDSICSPESNSNLPLVDFKLQNITIALISRRSRHRAGTRYRRRGVDESGKVANYVETEQIIEYDRHVLSFVQVRGSVPVYWSQPGYKYRPPPCIDKDEEVTQLAFETHFNEELSIYGSQTIISLLEKSAKEKVLGDAYLKHILKYNSAALTYITFDFHEYCRGLRFENVNLLVTSIIDIIRDMMFCWMDKDGIICEQNGTFRVNCVDCLDRTNVVQSHLAKKVLELQFSKLGLIVPEHSLPMSVHTILQIMWANNGDSLSRQYAGTAALKGDFTRTGERRLSGIMKDGYNSANRYFLNMFNDVYRQAAINVFLHEPLSEDLIQEVEQLDSYLQWGKTAVELPSNTNDLPFGLEIQLVLAAVALSRYYVNRFKDANRQGAIDLMLGKAVSFDDMGATADNDMTDSDLNWSEHVKQLIEECKKMLVPNSDVIMGGWALIDADPETCDPSQQDANVILILTRDSYYVAFYDDETDRISKYERVMLKDVEKIELGPEPSLFKSKFSCVRFCYVCNGQSGFFHMFRSTNLRFFNNMAIVIKTQEEAVESLKAICDTFLVALEVLNHNVPFHQGRLERKRSKVSSSQEKTNPFSSLYLDIPSLASIPRNVSEGQILALKMAGTKALSNVTSQIAKFNPMSLRSSFRQPVQKATTPIIPSSRPQFHIASSSDSDEETGGSSTGVPNENDVVLQSCGILVTGAGLRTTGNKCGSCPFTEDETSLISVENSVCDSGVPPSQHNKMTDIMYSNIIPDSDEFPEGSEGANGSPNEVKLRTRTPEIFISKDDDSSTVTVMEDMMKVAFQQRLSHSTEDISISSVLSTVDSVVVEGNVDSSSALEVGLLPMKTSHSEGAIKDFNTAKDSQVRNPVVGVGSSAIHKDAVLAPFTKLAKGVQSLGLNIHRATSRQARYQEESTSENNEIQKLKQQNCQTRIIEL